MGRGGVMHAAGQSVSTHNNHIRQSHSSSKLHLQHMAELDGYMPHVTAANSAPVLGIYRGVRGVAMCTAVATSVK